MVALCPGGKRKSGEGGALCGSHAGKNPCSGLCPVFYGRCIDMFMSLQESHTINGIKVISKPSRVMLEIGDNILNLHVQMPKVLVPNWFLIDQ